MRPQENQPDLPWSNLYPSFFNFGKKAHIPKAIDAKSFDAITASLHQERFIGSIKALNAGNPNLWKYLIGVGGALIFYGFYKGVLARRTSDEIAFRKQQLQKPVYELRGDELVNFPWKKDNLKEWLYRPVKVTGRQLHNKAMLIPRKLENYHGYEYIVPVVTKENEDGTYQEGILVNKGWMPHEYYHVGSRFRIENAFYPETFTCFVSEGGDHDYKRKFFKDGNAPEPRAYKWGHVYLPDMVKASGLKNADSAKVALLEAVELDTPLDERQPKLFEMTLGVDEDYPYPKTLSGALHITPMPWTLNRERNNLILFGSLTSAFGFALRFLH